MQGCEAHGDGPADGFANQVYFGQFQLVQEPQQVPGKIVHRPWVARLGG